MFTGIIEELGRVASISDMHPGSRIEIAASKVLESTSNGDSISVNGVCLTVKELSGKSFFADVSLETLNRSTLGGLKTGSSVNLERAATLSTRLGGHIVQGHVDARGTFISAVESGDFRTVTIGFPHHLGRYIVHKGSISVEGISLTVASLQDDSFEIAVIPKTWSDTNLSVLSPGDAVNLEVDLIAKYVERLIGFEQGTKESVDLELLQKAGFA